MFPLKHLNEEEDRNFNEEEKKTKQKIPIKPNSNGKKINIQ